MRYIAKIHVLDVMSDVVVSGYVYDADHATDPDHVPYEFSVSVPGMGVEDPYAWMLNAVYRALVADAETRPRK